MPNHKFHGRWTYYVMPDLFGAFPAEVGPLDLLITTVGGTIEPGSNLDQKPVTGTAGVDTLDFDHAVAAGFKRTHKGRLLLEASDWKGNKQMVIVGRFTKVAGTVRRGGKTRAATAQDEGTWIITKP